MDNPDTLTDTTTTLMHQITIEIPHAVAQKMAETYDGTLEDAALAGLKIIHGMGSPAHTTLHELAKQLGTSVPKTLRTAIAELKARADKLATAPTVGRPKINEERDAQVFGRVTRGATYAEIADVFGLSIVRVGQIMAQQRAMRGVPSRRKAYSKPPEVLTLKVPSEALAEDVPTPTPQPTEEPTQPRFVLPGLKTPDTTPPDTRTAIERDVVDPEFGF